MVKVKKATNIVPTKAAPLKKTIKKKVEANKDVAKKVVADIGAEKPHKPLVALPKKEKKVKVVAEKVKPLAKEKVKAKVEKQEKPKNKQVQVEKQKKPLKVEPPLVKVEKAKKVKKAPETKEKSAQKPKLAKKAPKPAVSVKIAKNGKVQKPIPNKKAKKLQHKPAQKKKQKPNGNPELANVPIKLTVSAEDLPTFNAEEFHSIVELSNVKKIAQALKKVVEEEVSAKKNALFTDYRYFLNVASFKIPDCPKRMVKLNVKYALINKEEDDVLIVVPDLQRGAKVDFEPTIEHYTDLFREHGVTGLGYRFKIMPFNQLRKEYKTFEAVRKLAATYEHFLCEGRIVGHVVGFVGKIFQKPRTTFHAVHLDKLDKMKERIQKALCRTAYKQLHKGDLISIPVGHHLHTPQQLAENVMCVVEQLKENYAGGLPNIRNIHLKIDIAGTTSLPLFISNCKPPTHTPYVVGPKEKRMIKLKREANAVLEKFNLDKKGDLSKLSNKQSAEKQKAKEYRQALNLEKNKQKLLVEDEAPEDEVPTKKVKLEENGEKTKKKDKKSKLLIKEEDVKEENDDEFVDELKEDDDNEAENNDDVEEDDDDDDDVEEDDDDDDDVEEDDDDEDDDDVEEDDDDEDDDDDEEDDDDDE